MMIHGPRNRDRSAIRRIQTADARHIDGCPCCWEKKDHGTLTQKPLKTLTVSDLSGYLGSVFLTAGGLGDFKYFLPRIFELAATDPEACLDVEISLRNLSRAEWQTWPVWERETMQSFIDAWFDAVTTRMQAPDDGIYYRTEIEGLLCGLAQADIALAPYLRRLLENPLAVDALYYANENRIEDKGRLQNAFWKDRREAEAEVVAFLKSEAVETVLLR
jgi:hypothetical protein